MFTANGLQPRTLPPRKFPRNRIRVRIRVRVRARVRVWVKVRVRVKDRPGSLFQPGPGSAKSAGTGILPGPGL